MRCREQILEKEVFPLLSGFYDTPFIVWLLKTQSKYNSKVFFEDQVGLNRHWLEMQWGHEDVDTLVTHYAGAQAHPAPATDTPQCLQPSPPQLPSELKSLQCRSKFICIDMKPHLYWITYGVDVDSDFIPHYCAYLRIWAQNVYGLASIIWLTPFESASQDTGTPQHF